MASGLEFFEELRGFIGEEAARIITRRTDSSSVLALRDDLRGVEARLSGEIRATESRMYGWMLTFHAGQWVAMAGLIVAIVLKG